MTTTNKQQQQTNNNDLATMEDTSETNSTVDSVVDATIESLAGTDEKEQPIENNTVATPDNHPTKESTMTTQSNNKADASMEDVNDTVALLLGSDSETEPPTPDGQKKNQNDKSLKEAKYISNNNKNNDPLVNAQESTAPKPDNASGSKEVATAAAAAASGTPAPTTKPKPVTAVQPIDTLVTATSASPATTATNAQPGSLAAIALGVNIRRDGLTEMQAPKRRKLLATKTIARMNRTKSVEEQAAAASIRAPTSAKKPVPVKPASVSTEPTIPPQKVYEGPPTKELPGGWPVGWIEERYKRMSGTCKGTEDAYWYSPTEPRYKLRSRTEIQRFLYSMRKMGDPKIAYSCRKNGPTADA